MNYQAYKIARNYSWKTLEECKITFFPLNLNQIIEYYNIIVIAYSKSNYIKSLHESVQNGDGFSREENGQKVIYFNDKKGCYERRRFTVAYELGHCIIGHDLTKIKFRNSEIDTPEDSIEEMQANVFARDILMPAFILKETNCITAEGISKLCHVSKQSAEIREQRLLELMKRNKFYLSYQEKQLKKQFEPFISSFNKNKKPC